MLMTFGWWSRWMRSGQLLIFLLHLSVILESLKGLIGSMMLPLLPSGLLPMVTVTNHGVVDTCEQSGISKNIMLEDYR
jgi:hypothetical protein